MAGTLQRLLALELAILKNVALEPLITGPLLYALTRASPNIRESLLQPFRNNVLSTNSASRLVKIVRTLKFLLALGVARRLNQTLNRLALNFWHLKSPGMPWNFKDGKTELIVITGGCSGFGYEMVKSFAGKAKVVVLDITEFPQELARLPGVHYYRCDITDFEGISSVAESIRNDHGNPTVLINNAGIALGTDNSVTKTNPQLLEKIFKVNLLSHFILIKEFLPAMLEGKKGHIVTVASMASFMGYAGLTDYCCTKSGALSLHEGLRGELRRHLPNGHCIQTTSVHPSWHRTGIVKPYAAAVEQAGVPIDPPTNVSDRIVEQVLSGRSGQIVIPESQKLITFRRMWPTWYEDIHSGGLLSTMVKF